MSDYVIRPIPAEAVAELRRIDDSGNSPERVASNGAPLRCCLGRSRSDEATLLVSYAPLKRWSDSTGADPGAYLERGPVFIHAAECSGFNGTAVPGTMRGARRVCRAYDERGRIRGGAYVEPGNGDAFQSIEEGMAEAFSDPGTELVHVRAVEYGCFLFEAVKR